MDKLYEYQPGFFERVVMIWTPEIANFIDPACRNSFNNYTPFSNELPLVETEIGQLQAYAKIEGMGRVYDLYHNQNGIVEVTFAHGKFASRFSGACIKHKWLRARELAAPIIEAPTETMADEFIGSSLFVALHPFRKNGRVVRPALEKGQLVRYRILTINEAGTEGIVVALGIP